MALNERQIRFCEEYLVDLNATQAAIRAGYSEKTATIIGFENLTKPNIQEYIQQRQKVLQEKTGITQERVLQEYARIAFFDIRKIYTDTNTLKDIKDLDDTSAAVIAGIDVTEEKAMNVVTGYTKKVKLHSKVVALEALGKHLGVFEKDNEQRKPPANAINITNVPTESLTQLEQILSQANDSEPAK